MDAARRQHLVAIACRVTQPAIMRFVTMLVVDFIMGGRCNLQYCKHTKCDRHNPASYTLPLMFS